MLKPVVTGRSRGWALLALSTLLVVSVAGCSPATQYRRSALVPTVAPFEWDGRTARRGTLRVEGAMSTVGVVTDALPQPGDTAVHVPRVMLHGAAAIAVTDGLELGARYSHGAYAWSRESADGTAPIPSGGAVTGFGPEIRGTFRFDKAGTFALGIGANYLFYSLPTSEWERDPSCIGSSSSSCFTDFLTTGIVTGYRLQSEGTEHTSAIAFGVYPSIAPAGGTYGHVFFGVAAQQGFKNDGFSDNASGRPVEGAGFVPLVGVGYGIKVDFFRASAMISVPLTHSPVDYSSPSGFLTIGGDIPLFGGNAGDTGAGAAAGQPN